jgi:hypothetical protein
MAVTVVPANFTAHIFLTMSMGCPHIIVVHICNVKTVLINLLWPNMSIARHNVHPAQTAKNHHPPLEQQVAQTVLLVSSTCLTAVVKHVPVVSTVTNMQHQLV